MNDEIKEILNEWKRFLSCCYENNDKTVEIHRDKLEYIIDYITNLQENNDNQMKYIADLLVQITNLQQENERLKEANKVLEKNWEHYMMRCGKAVEYIDKQKKKMYKSKNKIAMFILMKLEYILQNGSDS